MSGRRGPVPWPRAARWAVAVALVVRLDTPGGLGRSMRSAVQRILSAAAPVIAWIGPTGTR